MFARGNLCPHARIFGNGPFWGMPLKARCVFFGCPQNRAPSRERGKTLCGSMPEYPFCMEIAP